MRTVLQVRERAVARGGLPSVRELAAGIERVW